MPLFRSIIRAVTLDHSWNRFSPLTLGFSAAIIVAARALPKPQLHNWVRIAHMRVEALEQRLRLARSALALAQLRQHMHTIPACVGELRSALKIG